MKKLSYLFFALALVLSHLMCWTVAFNYRGMLCGILHEGGRHFRDEKAGHGGGSDRT